MSAKPHLPYIYGYAHQQAKPIIPFFTANEQANLWPTSAFMHVISTVYSRPNCV